MRTFLIASILWSLIFYVKGKYVDVPVLRYDADYVIEGVWMLAVPIGGVIYGGFTLLVLRCVNWCTAKLSTRSMSTLFLPATVKQYRDTVVAKPKEMWAIRAYGSYYWRVVQFSIAYRKSRRRFELNLKNLAELGVETKTVNEAVDLLKRIIPPEWYPIIAFRDTPEPSQFHYGVGMWIRALFGVWGLKNVELLKALGVNDPDSASYILELRLWGNLRRELGLPIRLVQRKPYCKPTAEEGKRDKSTGRTDGGVCSKPFKPYEPWSFQTRIFLAWIIPVAVFLILDVASR